MPRVRGRLAAMLLASACGAAPANPPPAPPAPGHEPAPPAAPVAPAEPAPAAPATAPAAEPSAPAAKPEPEAKPPPVARAKHAEKPPEPATAQQPEAAKRAEPAAAPPEPAKSATPPAVATPCGEKNQPRCPLQAWMEDHLQAAVDAADTAALAKGLTRAASLSPDPSWSAGAQSWPEIARTGAAAATAGDLSAAKQACKTCHKAWRSKYKASFRTRAVAD